MREPRHRWLLAIGIMAVTAWLVAGCQLLGLGGGRYPDACAELGFSPARCNAIVESKRDQLKIQQDQIAEVDILPPAGADTVRLGGQMIARVRFRLVDGTVSTHEFWCLGVGSADDRACNELAQIDVWGGVDHDIPCAGPAPAGCASEPPPPRSTSVADARPLRVASLDIPLDHLGHYRVDLGEAGLPDGYLTTRSGRLVDSQPTDFWIEHGVSIRVEPADPSRPPIGSRYREPFDGVEPVRVFLEFDVVETSPGAILQVRDIEVA